MSAYGPIFSIHEIKRLGKRFRKIDADHSGTLSTAELMQVPGLEKNRLVPRVIDVFDRNNDGEIDFKEFVTTISYLSERSSSDSKYKFLFKIYDLDGDGFISNGELFQVIRMASGNSLKDTQVQQMCDKTMLYLDRDGDGRIGFRDFYAVASTLRLHQKMRLNV